jgi:folate-dependent tRNA-U54 methylase TrmFO/GidA
MPHKESLCVVPTGTGRMWLKFQDLFIVKIRQKKFQNYRKNTLFEGCHPPNKIASGGIVGTHDFQGSDDKC